ncbi:hypothetical protein GG344DRAFT_82772 [Lentinula edodes]|nr:hypothetical protein GG344DRAFT_82772 [Lentinula edodes]
MPQANSTNQDNREQNVPQSQGTIGRNIKKPEVDQSMLGISSSHSPNTGVRSFDYMEKYADEPFGEELKDNSRVFKVYLDEAEIFDDDMIRGFRETIDSLLVFAALFSGIVTSFVIAAISALQPDYSHITAVLLVEQVQILRAAGNATAINDIPKSTVDLQNVSVATDDLWINGLFLASLSLALATALLSVLVKQWLQAYSSILAGSAKHKALLRQFRYAGFEKWKVPEIVGILPLILHTSLALFLTGLSLYISELHSSLSWIVVTVTILAFAFYLRSLLLPQATQPWYDRGWGFARSPFPHPPLPPLPLLLPSSLPSSPSPPSSFPPPSNSFSSPSSLSFQITSPSTLHSPHPPPSPSSPPSSSLPPPSSPSPTGRTTTTSRAS